MPGNSQESGQSSANNGARIPERQSPPLREGRCNRCIRLTSAICETTLRLTFVVAVSISILLLITPTMNLIWQSDHVVASREKGILPP